MLKITVIYSIFILLINQQGLCQNAVSESYSGYNDGEYFEKFNNDKLKSTFTIKNGKLQGPNIVYYKNGKQNIYCEFDKGYFDGLLINFDKHGDTSTLTLFKHDTIIKHTDITYFFLSHKIKYRSIFDFCDSLNENVSGNITTSAIDQYYYIDFQAITEDFYNKSLYLKYYRNGTLAQEATGISTFYSGLFKFFYKNGELKRIVTFNKGQKDGMMTMYNRHGKAKKNLSYSNGKVQK